MLTTVVHWRDRPSDIRLWTHVGRPSQFGNPFTAKQYGREEAIARYRDQFYRKLRLYPEFKAAVDALAGQVLVCYCKPLPCHGDVIADYLNRRPS